MAKLKKPKDGQGKAPKELKDFPFEFPHKGEIMPLMDDMDIELMATILVMEVEDFLASLQ